MLFSKRRPLSIPASNVAAHAHLLTELQRYAKEGLTCEAVGVEYGPGFGTAHVMHHPAYRGIVAPIVIVRALCERVIGTEFPGNSRDVIQDMIGALTRISQQPEIQRIQECQTDIRETCGWLNRKLSGMR